MPTFRSEVDPTMLLRVHGGGGNIRIAGRDVTAIEATGPSELETFLQPDGKTLTINGYPDDLEIVLPRRASIELHAVGGNVEVHSVAEVGAQTMPKLTAHGVGGDVHATQVGQIELHGVGGNVVVEGGCEVLKIGSTGGNVRVTGAAQLSLKAAGGDVRLEGIGRLVRLGHIGGNLDLNWQGDAEGSLRGTVGGDARLHLPESINLTVSAISGGGVRGSGEGWTIDDGPGRGQYVFGEGGPTLSLMLGGRVEISGGKLTSQSAGWGGFGEGWPGFGAGDWQDMRGRMDSFGEEMRGLGREMEELGRNLARELSGLGRDIAREVRVAGRDARRNMHEDWQRGRPPRMQVRINDREFNLDPEQIDRIKREARAAAASGIARAQEAVEQALQQWQQNAPRRPGAPRPPGSRPTPPQPPRPPQPHGPYTGQTVRIDREADDVPPPPAAEAAPPRDLDAERLAILRMVHEGRLAPDEAEVLLRGLEDRS